MAKKKLPNWKIFKEIGFIYTEKEQDYLRAIYTNLDDDTWSHFIQLYGSEKRFVEAFGGFAYWFIKYQNERKQPFNPVEWFKHQHDLATKLKKAVEKSELDAGLQIISDFENNYENKVVFNRWGNKDYYKIVARDFCEILGNFEKSWEFQKDRNRVHGLPEIWRYLKQVSPKPLSADLLLACFGKNYLGLTDYGIENLTSVKIVVNEMLQNHFEEFGNNPLYRIVSKYRKPILNGDQFEDLKKYFALNEEFEEWKAKTLDYCVKMNKERELKTGFPLFSEPWFKSVDLYVSSENDYFPNILHKALSNFFEDMFRKAENEVRISKRIPKIGEGWVNETELFNRLKKSFSNFKIVQHATPKWLNGQHFDIYFPNEKIAIEYHGKQHFEPVDFFGGEESFEKQKERDLRKIKLAEFNGCKLIIVRKGYDFEKITRKISDHIFS